MRHEHFAVHVTQGDAHRSTLILTRTGIDGAACDITYFARNDREMRLLEPTEHLAQHGPELAGRLGGGGARSQRIPQRPPVYPIVRRVPMRPCNDGPGGVKCHQRISNGARCQRVARCRRCTGACVQECANGWSSSARRSAAMTRRANEQQRQRENST